MLLKRIHFEGFTSVMQVILAEAMNQRGIETDDLEVEVKEMVVVVAVVMMTKGTGITTVTTRGIVGLQEGGGHI